MYIIIIIVINYVYLNYKNIVSSKLKFDGIYFESNINNEKVIFLKPQKYMNLSGEVVRRFVDYFKIKVEDILVIHDDLDQEIGKIKLKQNSSSGGGSGCMVILCAIVGVIILAIYGCL